MSRTRSYRTPPTVDNWPGVFVLFPGTQLQLAERLGLSPQGLHNLRTLVHARPPHHLLQKLAAVLRRGTADGSPAPTQQTLTRLWNLAKSETER